MEIGNESNDIYTIRMDLRYDFVCDFRYHLMVFFLCKFPSWAHYASIRLETMENVK